MSDFMNSGDVNIDQLFNMFKAAYLKPTFDEDGELFIKSAHGMPIFVFVNNDHEYIRLMVNMELNDKTKRQDKLALMNDMNSSMIYSRFMLREDNLLQADSFILFKEGVSTLQILSAIRLFEQTINAAIQEHNVWDIII
jgi:hypothetical protein